MDSAERANKAALGHYLRNEITQAQKICEQILEGKPSDAKALHLMGLIVHRSGQHQAAERLLKNALASGRDSPEFFCDLAKVCLALGRREESIANLRRAVAANPKLDAVHAEIGELCRSAGRIEEGAQGYLKALVLKPDNAAYQKGMASCLRGRAVASTEPRFLRAIELCFERPEVDRQQLMVSAVSTLKRFEGFRQALDWASDHERLKAAYRDDELRDLIESSLFHRLLDQAVLADPAFEYLTTALRRVILEDICRDAGRVKTNWRKDARFLCALAHQCFNNEYAFFVDDAENARVTDLIATVGPEIGASPRPGHELQRKLVVCAMYRSLDGIEAKEQLRAVKASVWSRPFRAVVKRQLDDRRREQEIKDKIPPVTEVSDKTSLLVKSQYEENPYPRWLNLWRETPVTVPDLLAMVGTDIVDPRDWPRPTPLLVAGCGTGHEALTAAVNLKDCEVFAVDLSLSSLGYAWRMAEELEIANVSFHSGDILSLAALDRRFSFIACSGVLHHMAEPMRGWRVLVDLLQPTGLMLIGLYSQRARDVIERGREFVKEEGFEPTEADIRRCRREILDLGLQHPLSRLTRSRDFFSISACRDMILHYMEHRFTLPEIEACLAELGLRFLSFRFDNTAALEAFKKEHPEPADVTDLRVWDRYEEAHPQTFFGMYNFWCQNSS